MQLYSTDVPIYSLATAYAPSAIAIIRLSGTDTIKLLSSYFSAPAKLVEAKTNTLVYGLLQDGEDIVDEVVLAVYKKGHGYTSEEAIEINAHGSLAGIKRIFKLLEKAGFRQALRGEFSFRAFMHGRIDLTEAEAVEELINSKSTTSQQRALDRLEGKLKNILTDIEKRILYILASLEVQLDYAEDEILEEWEFPHEEVLDIIKKLNTISSTYSANKVFREGAKVVLAGLTNAGKSSLFNILTKEERAIVSPIKGTTRDFIESYTDFAGIPVRLFDTAGLRDVDDFIEAEGIKRSQKLIDDADLVIYLIDPKEEDITFPECKNLVKVYTKNDIHKNLEGLSVSTVTGDGIGELINQVAAILSKGSFIDEAEVAIDSLRQKEGIEECVQCLEDAIESEFSPVDIMALYFQAALGAIGKITGEVTNDDLLDTLFSSFCVGK